MEIIDLLIVLAFLIVIFFIGIKQRKKISLEDYWANSRNTNTFTLVATMLSTFIGASALIALANIGYTGGMASLIIGLSFVFYFIIFALFIAPRIKRAADKIKAYTLPDILAVRYSPSVRVVSGLVNIIIFTLFLAVQFLAVGSFIALVTNLGIIVGTVIGGLIMIIYTSIGGLKSDIRTDVFQFFVMLILIIIFLPLLVIKSGGFNSLTKLPSNYFTGTAFADPIVLVAAFLFIGVTTMSSSDVWQRVYAAKDEKSVKKGMLWTGILILPFFILATAMGMFGKVLYPELIDSNLLIAKELFYVLPIGLLGLGLAGFFAALMSSADSSLLVISQTLVRDFYQSFFRKNMSEEQTLKLSKKVTFVLGILSLIVALIFLSILNLSISAVSLGVVLLPAIFCAFFWKKSTAKAALFSIIIGSITIFATLPFMKEEAFIPGLILSFISFILISLFTKHSINEQSLN